MEKKERQIQDSIDQAIANAGSELAHAQFDCLASDPVSRFVFRGKQGIPPAQRLLDTVLRKPEVVTRTKSQHRFAPLPDGKEGIADVQIQTESGRIFIIEFQRYREKNYRSQQRLTAYSAMQVTELLQKGNGWLEVKPVCVMMMTEEDVLQEGRSQYTIIPYVQELGRPAEEFPFLSGMPEYIYLNAGTKDDNSPTARLVRDFFEKDLDQIQTPEIREALQYARGQNRKEWTMFVTQELADLYTELQKEKNQLAREIRERDRRDRERDKRDCERDKREQELTEKLKAAEKLLQEHGISYN